jgi:hypothetical protein
MVGNEFWLAVMLFSDVIALLTTEYENLRKQCEVQVRSLEAESKVWFDDGSLVISLVVVYYYVNLVFMWLSDVSFVDLFPFDSLLCLRVGQSRGSGCEDGQYGT